MKKFYLETLKIDVPSSVHHVNDCGDIRPRIFFPKVLFLLFLSTVLAILAILQLVLILPLFLAGFFRHLICRYSFLRCEVTAYIAAYAVYIFAIPADLSDRIITKIL